MAQFIQSPINGLYLSECILQPPIEEVIEEEKPSRKSPPDSDKSRDRDISLSMAPLPIPLPLGFGGKFQMFPY